MNWSFTLTDGSGDIISLSDCTMTPEAFKRVYWSMVRHSASYHEAYEKAEDIHQQIFSKRKYSSYMSFVNTVKK